MNDLNDTLWLNRSTVLGQWIDVVFDSYPTDTSKFLRRQKDNFANPVGAAVREGLEGLFDGLFRPADGEPRPPFTPDIDYEHLRPLLDRIVRIRAVQNFSPSQAIFFVQQLKSLIRDTLAKKLTDQPAWDQLAVLEARVDRLLFLAFDVYCACRNTLAEIRVDDERRRVHTLLRRAGMMDAGQTTDEPAGEIELPDLRAATTKTNLEER